MVPLKIARSPPQAAIYSSSPGNLPVRRLSQQRQFISKRVRTERARNRADSGSIAPLEPVERLPKRASQRITRPTRKSIASHRTVGQHHHDKSMNAVRKAVGIEKKQTVTDQILDESCPKLSYNQRLTGYVLCMSIGFLLTIGSLVRLKALLHGDPAPFVIYFTFGNLCAIASCFFLSGPKSHCKKMIDPTRRIATAFYLITIFFTFFVVFYEKIPDDGRVGIIILCVFIQWIAMIWYTISFIPFARDWVCMCCCQAPRDFCKKHGIEIRYK